MDLLFLSIKSIKKMSGHKENNSPHLQEIDPLKRFGKKHICVLNLDTTF